MFYVNGPDGTRLATFRHRSELDAYLDASYPKEGFTSGNRGDINNFDIINDDEKVVAHVIGPSEYASESPDRPAGPGSH